MKTRQTIRRGLLAFLGLGTVLGVTGCRHFGHSWGKMSEAEKAEHISEKIVDKLDLNASQKKLADDLAKEIASLGAGMRSRHSQNSNTVRGMILSDALDQNKVRELFTQKRERMDGAFDTLLPKVAALHASLSAEQKAEVAEFLDKHHKRGHHFRRHHW